ncbi:hypothetical protein ACWDKQ_24175 [Saccharopolyspora sp. NPDC000995]
MFAGLHGFASLAASGMPLKTSIDAALDGILDEIQHGVTPR